MCVCVCVCMCVFFFLFQIVIITIIIIIVSIIFYYFFYNYYYLNYKLFGPFLPLCGAVFLMTLTVQRPPILTTISTLHHTHTHTSIGHITNIYQQPIRHPPRYRFLLLPYPVTNASSIHRRKQTLM